MAAVQLRRRSSSSARSRTDFGSLAASPVAGPERMAAGSSVGFAAGSAHAPEVVQARRTQRDQIPEKQPRGASPRPNPALRARDPPDVRKRPDPMLVDWLIL